MSARCRFAQTLSVSLFVGLLAGQVASAYSHPDYYGPNISFTGITESSSWGDPDPLFGAPTGVNDALLFFPPNFVAAAAGAGVSDQTGSQLQANITATALNATIDTIVIDEFGDYTLLGPVGTDLTSVTLVIAGYVTILEIGGISVAPITIGFDSYTPLNTTVNPVTLATTGLTLPPIVPVGLWSANVTIDLATLYPGVTKAFLSLDNDLYAYSEAGSNVAKIQKKVVDGPAVVVSVIPEPGTFALVCGGLLALSLRGRSRRS